MELPIYLDYMATTPLDPNVLEIMLPYLKDNKLFGNPASTTHAYGWRAQAAVDKAREEVAQLIHAEPREIIWTSGATESNNLALFGAARFYQRKGSHIITCPTEHKSVLDPCKQLQREGFELTMLPVEKTGLIDLEKLRKVVTAKTVVVAIMQANNEIGVIQNIKEIAKIVHENGALLHVDAAQSVGKIPVDVKKLDIDLLSISAHKMYGPKGIGALYVRQTPPLRLQPLIYGGGHEHGLRSGTLAPALIAGMGEAAKIASTVQEYEYKKLLNFRDRLLQKILVLKEVYINGDLEERLPGNLNLSFNRVEGESLLLALKDLAISTTSACISAGNAISHVLQAIQVPEELIQSTIRISFGRFTSEAEIDYAGDLIVEQVNRLRQISTF